MYFHVTAYHLASFSGSPNLASFLCKHDVIKIGPEQKGSILCTVQPAMCSWHGVCDI